MAFLCVSLFGLLLRTIKRKREKVASELIINSTPVETRVALLDNGVINDLVIERERDKGLVGSVYKGRILRVLPGMQACFVDIGLDRAAFLYVDDIQNESISSSDLFIDEESEKTAKPEVAKAQIQDLVKEGQEILVQVAKDPLGTKGARITTHISLPGRNLVYMPTVAHIGISRRIENEEERKRLKDIVTSVVPLEGGFIVRTASGKSQAEKRIKQDIDYLARLWAEIREKAASVQAPSLVYEDLNSVLRAIRDWVSEDIDKIIVDSRYHYNENKPESLEPEKDGHDHACDALRYMLLNLDEPHRTETRNYLGGGRRTDRSPHP